jgi:hypothetical protein
MLHNRRVLSRGRRPCDKTICLEGDSTLRPREHPEMCLDAHSFGAYMPRLERKDWQHVVS